MKKRESLRRVAALATVLVLTAACGGTSPPPTPSEGPPTDPLMQMVIAFDGNYSRTEIKAAMDRAMTATHTQITPEGYSRGGDVLVTFRQKYGIKEMDVLECMPHRSRDPRIAEQGREISFASVAAVCATDLVQGDYP